MKFKMQVKCDGCEPWWEEYDKDTDDPQKWAEDIVAWFNSTCRPGEKPRTLLAVEIIDSTSKHHKWVKHVKGMSIQFRGATCDIMYCSVCGITGKRYGLNNVIKRDSKFRKKAFDYCNTSQKELVNQRQLEEGYINPYEMDKCP